MINRFPGLIVRCAGVADVKHAVDFARKHDLLISVRGGGHNIAGSCLTDGGLMIDLSQMRGVRVDPVTKTARVEPGCTLADFDHEAQAFELATPVGINSTTGIAGLTLGGGFGWLSRKYGMTVDNLLSADVVTADGNLLTVSQDSHADLFWALRGGGGNFGIITSFKFQLHQVGPQVLSGLVVYPYQHARQVLQFYREFSATLPDEAVVWAVMRKAPPLPFLAEEWHGKEVVILAVFYEGDVSVGKVVLDPIRAFGNSIADVVGPHVYTSWQQAFDPLLTSGARNYWKSHNLSELSDEVLDLLITRAGNLPTPQTEIFVAQVGGQISRIGNDETAYANRDAKYIVNVHTRWDTAPEDEQNVQWTRSFFNELAPFATGGVYVNFMAQDEETRIQAAYGLNLERLSEIKSKYDRHNMFRSNQNILPTAFA
ncbi:FAD-binding oxidoreductase [Pontibacter qinzhouensis]|uniref:FAD-binding oxidoreductase n=2 Tax=Pontibacter qinzhouensis TaxID=2603253 RepID=A0A5C8KAJ6_9BACT|nr:FAD-binding oxidoreductase [Pontibacter qinzhouensis]